VSRPLRRENYAAKFPEISPKIEPKKSAQKITFLGIVESRKFWQKSAPKNCPKISRK